MVYSSSARMRFYYRLHVVWASKHRDMVSQGAMRKRIREIIRQTCEEMGVHILKGVLARDQTHMVLTGSPKLSLPIVKQRTRPLLEMFPNGAP